MFLSFLMMAIHTKPHLYSPEKFENGRFIMETLHCGNALNIFRSHHAREI